MTCMNQLAVLAIAEKHGCPCGESRVSLLRLKPRAREGSGGGETRLKDGDFFSGGVTVGSVQFWKGFWMNETRVLEVL